MKRKNLELIEDLTAIVKTQGERIDTLQKALDTVLERNPQLVEQDKPKMLDQSVFDGQDERFRFAVSNHRGMVFLLCTKPEQHHLFSGWRFDSSYRCKALVGDYDTSRWQNSLIEREAKPLSGNERIKKLLEEQKFVIVRVSDKSYEDALDNGYLRVCHSISGMAGVRTADVGIWAYAIPIDNNGNEILDVE